MKSSKLAILTILAISSAISLAMAADPQPAVPVEAAPAAEKKQPADVTDIKVSPSAPTAAMKTESKPDRVIIHLNAPFLSPKFANTPLASINDEVITIEDLKNALGIIHSGMGEEKAAPKKNFSEVLKRLINSSLMIQEARNMQLDTLDEIKAPMDAFKKDLLRETILNEHVKNVAADEKEVEKVYRQRTREWRLKSLILLKLSDTKTLEAELKAGKSFDEFYDAAIRDGRGRVGGKVEDFLPRDAINPTMLAELDSMKVGEVGKPIALEKGYVVYRVEEVRSKEDPKAREQVRQELGSQLRVKKLQEYQKELVKKYVKVHQKFFDKLDFESKKNKFEKLLKDKRVIAEIKGEKPLTVADMSEAVAAHFYHGVTRAIEGKKVNKEKKAILEQLLGTMVFDKEARALKLDMSEEYRNKVKNQENKLLFGAFIQKVVTPEITISRDEVKTYYNEHAKEYTSPDSYVLAAIAFDSPERAEEAAKKLKAGTDFKWYSDNAEGRESIGNSYLAYFEGNPVTKLELPGKMQQVLSGAVNGDYRVFVDGITGYVIAVKEYRPPEVMAYEAVEGVMKEALSYEKLNKAIETWAKKLRDSSEVIEYADFEKQEKP